MATASGGRRHAELGVLVAVAAAFFCIQVDFFALNLALPGISVDFGVTTDAVQWVVSAYMLALGSLFIVGGRLGDRFGHRRIMVAGTVLFGAGSVGAALSPDLTVLVAFRIVQGAGAALMFPVGVAMVTNAFPEGRRVRALGLVFAIGNVGTALGPFIGGGLTSGPGWRWVFWFLVPFCALAIWILAFVVSDAPARGPVHALDGTGAALVAGAVASLSAAVDQGSAWGWGSAPTLSLFLAAALLLAGFVWRERRVPDPLVDPALVRNLPFVLVTSIGAVANVAYAVTVLLVSLDLQDVRGLSPLLSGVVFLAPATMVALSGLLSAWLQARARPSIVMATTTAVAGLLLVVLTVTTSWVGFVPVFALCGLALGLGWSFANVATQELVPVERAGEASGVVLTTLVTMGGVGVAAAAVTVSALQQDGHTLQFAYQATLRVVAVLAITWSGAMMVVRHLLVRRGHMPPWSMKSSWAGYGRVPAEPSAAEEC